MSQQNMEIVKAVIDAYNREDWDAGFRYAAPGAEMDFSRALGPYRGIYALDQVRPFINDFAATFESIRMDVDQLIDAGEHVVLLGTAHFLGRDGAEAKTHAIQTWTVRDGAVERMVMYQKREDALEAVGLSEDDARQNLEIVRKHFADTNARRFDAALRAYDPQVELVVSEDVAVDPGTYRGVDAVGEWFGSWFRTFAANYRMELVELLPVKDAVVAAVDHRGVGRRSGAEVTTRYYNAYWIREDVIVRLAIFSERSEAMKAVGLSK